MHVALIGTPESGKREYFAHLVSGSWDASSSFRLSKHPMLATLEHSSRECLFFLVDADDSTADSFSHTISNARGCVVFLETSHPDWLVKAHHQGSQIRAIANIPIAFVECVKVPATSRLTPMDILDLLHAFGQELTSCMILTLPQTVQEACRPLEWIFSFVFQDFDVTFSSLTTMVQMPRETAPVQIVASMTCSRAKPPQKTSHGIILYNQSSVCIEPNAASKVQTKTIMDIPIEFAGFVAPCDSLPDQLLLQPCLVPSLGEPITVQVFNASTEPIVLRAHEPVARVVLVASPEIQLFLDNEFA